MGVSHRRPRPRRSRMRLPRRFRRDAHRCARCRKKLRHVGGKVWRALGRDVAIRCLDCRMAFCPPCARNHFAPVIRAQERIMNAVVTAAIKTMRIKCKGAPQR